MSKSSSKSATTAPASRSRSTGSCRPRRADEGSFIQILEGDQATVESLYAKIAADPRHSNSILLFRVDTDERAFDQWTMGFHQLNRDSDDTPEGLNRFLDNGIPGITSNDGEKIRDILLGFREGKWRRTVDH